MRLQVEYYLLHERFYCLNPRVVFLLKGQFVVHTLRLFCSAYHLSFLIAHLDFLIRFFSGLR